MPPATRCHCGESSPATVSPAAKNDLDGERNIQCSVWLDPVLVARVQKEAAALPHPLVAIAPTANWIGKVWPQRHWAELLKASEGPLADARFVILGDARERAFVADLIDAIPPEKLIDKVGKLSLTETAAWIGACDFFIGHDSGLAQIAAAQKVPGLVLFGPTRDDLYAPWFEGLAVVAPPSRPRSEVNLEPTALPRLMTDLTMETVRAQLPPVLPPRR